MEHLTAVPTLQDFPYTSKIRSGPAKVTQLPLERVGIQVFVISRDLDVGSRVLPRMEEIQDRETTGEIANRLIDYDEMVKLRHARNLLAGWHEFLGEAVRAGAGRGSEELSRCNKMRQTVFS